MAVTNSSQWSENLFVQITSDIFKTTFECDTQMNLIYNKISQWFDNFLLCTIDTHLQFIAAHMIEKNQGEDGKRNEQNQIDEFTCNLIEKLRNNNEDISKEIIIPNESYLLNRLLTLVISIYMINKYYNIDVISCLHHARSIAKSIRSFQTHKNLDFFIDKFLCRVPTSPADVKIAKEK